MKHYYVALKKVHTYNYPLEHMPFLNIRYLGTLDSSAHAKIGLMFRALFPKVKKCEKVPFHM